MHPPPIPQQKTQRDAIWFLNKFLLIIGIGIIIWGTTLPIRCVANAMKNKQEVVNADIITLSEYSALKAGMSYKDVSQIIGEYGVEVSSNVIPGVTGVMPTIVATMYTWTNPDGSNMNAMFQNDELIQRAQFGLD